MNESLAGWWVTFRGERFRPIDVTLAARSLLASFLDARSPSTAEVVDHALKWNAERSHYPSADLERAIREQRAIRRFVYVPDDEMDDFHAACARWLP